MHLLDESGSVLPYHHTIDTSLTIKIAGTSPYHPWWLHGLSPLNYQSRKSIHVTHGDATNRVISTTQTEISLCYTWWRHGSIFLNNRSRNLFMSYLVRDDRIMDHLGWYILVVTKSRQKERSSTVHVKWTADELPTPHDIVVFACLLARK